LLRKSSRRAATTSSRSKPINPNFWKTFRRFSRGRFPPSLLEPEEDFRSATSVEKSHGRLEERTLQSTDLLNDYLEWPGPGLLPDPTLSAWCPSVPPNRLRHHQSTKGKASPQDLLALARQHWGIENRLFCVRDVMFREDACRVRTGSLPQVLAALRNTCITAFRRLGYTNNVEGLEHFSEHRRHTIRFIRQGRIK